MTDTTQLQIEDAMYNALVRFNKHQMDNIDVIFEKTFEGMEGMLEKVLPLVEKMVDDQ